MGRSITVQSASTRTTGAELCQGLRRVFERRGYRVALMSVGGEDTCSDRDDRGEEAHSEPKDLVKCHRSLQAEHDLVIIESTDDPSKGIGDLKASPSMRLSTEVASPVILVGDHRCGNAFTQIAGALSMMDEKSQVKAIVISGLRKEDHPSDSDLRRFERLCRHPLVGTLPPFELPASEMEMSAHLQRSSFDGLMDVAAIHFPSFANHCEFSALEATPGIKVRQVHNANELGTPDLIVIPGSTSSLSDLLWMRKNRLEEAIVEQAGKGVPLFGICGGYQMLGTIIIDEKGIEGGGSIRGMGLLPIETVFTENKRRTRQKARVCPLKGPLAPLSGITVEGYEMHLGRTRLLKDGTALCLLEDGTADGCWHGNVYGTYLHGFFDEEDCCWALLASLHAMRNPRYRGDLDLNAMREFLLDRLADSVRDNLDLAQIDQIIGSQN